MSGGLIIDLHRSGPTVVIRPSGVLDARTSEDLRDVLIDLLAEQVPGVVVDADQLTVADAVGSAVFRQVVAENSVWPDIPLAVAGRGAAVAALAGAAGGKPAITVWPDRQAAVAALVDTPVAPIVRLPLPPARESPAPARAAVDEFCRQQGVCLGPRDCTNPRCTRRAGAGTAVEAAALVASELVTNAVVHAGTAIELTLRLVERSGAARLDIGVRDGGPWLLGPSGVSAGADDLADSGRGLLLVAAFAAAWGVRVSRNGKIVWATMNVTTCL